MNHTDFFEEYKNKKQASEDLFKSIESKFGPLNEGMINEAIEDLKDYFYKIMQAPNWEPYKLFLGDNADPKYIEVGKATKDQINQAWNIIAQQAKADGFKGEIKNTGKNGTVVYNSIKKQDANQDQESAETGETQNAGPANYQLIKTKQGYQFGGPERIATTIDNAQSEINNYDWGQSPLKFLFEPHIQFNGSSIAFDFKRGIILDFKGTWNGLFVGKMFDGIYKGESFNGNFSSKNENWQSPPTAFVDGTFNDTTKTGILELNNVTNANLGDEFHLIQVPVGFSIEILTSKQLRHTITVSKRLDNIDSNFSYSVYMGYNMDATPNIVTLPWSKIRQEFDSYSISYKTKSIPGLLTLQSDEQIIELSVLKAGTPPVFKKKEKFDATKQYSEDVGNLSGLKDLTRVTRYNLNLKLNDDQDFENFTKMKGYVDSPKFMQDLDSISTFLDNDIITAADIAKFPYLKNIFTSEVLSEASFTGAKNKRYKSFSQTGSGSGSIPRLPGSNQPLKTAADIATYLNDKYKEDLKIGRQDRYNKESKELYDLIVLKKPIRKSAYPTSSQQSVQTQEKESDAALGRLNNFVKNFVYKIDAGSKTNEVRAFIIDAIKKKIKPAPQEQPEVQAQTQGVDPTKGIAQPNVKGPLTHESFIRLEIRNILEGLL